MFILYMYMINTLFRYGIMFVKLIILIKKKDYVVPLLRSIKNIYYVVTLLV